MRPRRDRQEQPWGRLLVSHQQIYSTISLSHSADTETPSRWEKIMIKNGMLSKGMKTPEPPCWVGRGNIFTPFLYSLFPVIFVSVQSGCFEL